MRAVAKTADLPRIFSQPFCNLWLGQGAHFVHYPLHGGKDVNMVLTLDAAKAGDDWQQRYLGRNDILGQLCDHADIKWVKTALPAHPYHDCWRRGRTVLAGDAAHPIPPNLAQGAGQSLVDAASLLRWMADDNLDSALSGYARERSKAVGVIFKKAAVSSKIMALDGTERNGAKHAYWPWWCANAKRMACRGLGSCLGGISWPWPLGQIITSESRDQPLPRHGISRPITQRIIRSKIKPKLPMIKIVTQINS